MEIKIPKLGLNELANAIHLINKDKKFDMITDSDWYTEIGRLKIASKLALVHSEVSEGFEWLRLAEQEGYLFNGKLLTFEQLKNKTPSIDKLIKHYKDIYKENNDYSLVFKHPISCDFEYLKDKNIKTNFGEELIDIIIKCLDIGIGMGFDMNKLMWDKLNKNIIRGKKHDNKTL